jgi:hypothetical protein
MREALMFAKNYALPFSQHFKTQWMEIKSSAFSNFLHQAHFIIIRSFTACRAGQWRCEPDFQVFAGLMTRNRV